MIKKGKKTKEWEAIRSELKNDFYHRGIVTCELRYSGCWYNNALGFAHGAKRHNLRPGELKTLVILVCNSCHEKIEYLPAEEMRAIVERVINNRNV